MFFLADAVAETILVCCKVPAKKRVVIRRPQLVMEITYLLLGPPAPVLVRMLCPPALLAWQYVNMKAKG